MFIYATTPRIILERLNVGVSTRSSIDWAISVVESVVGTPGYFCRDLIECVWSWMCQSSTYIWIMMAYWLIALDASSSQYFRFLVNLTARLLKHLLIQIEVQFGHLLRLLTSLGIVQLPLILVADVMRSEFLWEEFPAQLEILIILEVHVDNLASTNYDTHTHTSRCSWDPVCHCAGRCWISCEGPPPLPEPSSWAREREWHHPAQSTVSRREIVKLDHWDLWVPRCHTWEVIGTSPWLPIIMMVIAYQSLSGHVGHHNLLIPVQLTLSQYLVYFILADVFELFDFDWLRIVPHERCNGGCDYFVW